MSENTHTLSSYAVIPSYIMEDKTLEDGAKLLYARISMYSKEGRCWASNKHFSEKHGVCVRTIQLWIKQLSDAGYIEVDIDKSGYQTKRDIWITNDFKKIHMKRNTFHPGANDISPHGETHFMQINTSNINIKENNNKGAAAPPPAVVVSSEEKKRERDIKTPKAKQAPIPKVLAEIDELNEEDKHFLSQYDEKRILLALEFAKIEKPTTTLAQLLKWHCSQNKPPKPNPKKWVPEKCKEIAKMYESSSCEMQVTEDAVFFIPTTSQSTPTEVKFSEQDVEKKILDLLRKYKFVKK